MRIYDRFISSQEFADGSVKSLQEGSEPTLFRFRAEPTEAPAHGGPLTLKAATKGNVSYRFGRHELATGPQQVLIAPPSATYSTHVGRAGAGIVTLYFPNLLAFDALACLTETDERLLQGTPRPANLSFDFPAHRRAASPRLHGLIRNLAAGRSQHLLAALALEALEETLLYAVEASGAVRRAPATKASVRRELFRRACIARDLIEQNVGRPLVLEELADTACLSPFHLHRVFKAAFGETPAQMHRRRRIETARKMLASPRRSIGDIAAAVGFDSDSAFSRSFRALTGQSPSAYRQSVSR